MTWYGNVNSSRNCNCNMVRHDTPSLLAYLFGSLTQLAIEYERISKSIIRILNLQPNTSSCKFKTSPPDCGQHHCFVLAQFIWGKLKAITLVSKEAVWECWKIQKKTLIGLFRIAAQAVKRPATVDYCDRLSCECSFQKPHVLML